MGVKEVGLGAFEGAEIGNLFVRGQNEEGKILEKYDAQYDNVRKIGPCAFKNCQILNKFEINKAQKLGVRAVENFKTPA